MKKIKGRKIVSDVPGETEYALKNGLIASVIDIDHPKIRPLYKMMGLYTYGKTYSVEIITKTAGARIIVEGARPMSFNEMVKYLDEVEKK